MAAKARGREGKGGISPRALLVSARGETPSPGVELVAQAGDPAAAGAGSPAGAASKKKGRALERVRCPLCGKLMPKRSAALHAFSHLEALERSGIVKLARESGGWIVMFSGRKIYGASWTTLLKVAEEL